MKKEFFAAVFTAVVVCLTFAFAGCEGAAGDSNTSPEGDASVNNEDDTNGTLESGLIVATAPNDFEGKPFVGDFTFDGNVVCTQVSECKFEATGSVKIEFTHPLALFLNKYASANPDEDQQVVWDQPGDWGLAPQGMYRDEKEGAEGQAKTSQDAEHGILLEWKYTGPLGVVNGDSFEWDDGEHKIVGTISPDLKEIKFHKSFNGVESDRTLTLVE